MRLTTLVLAACSAVSSAPPTSDAPEVPSHDLSPDTADTVDTAGSTDTERATDTAFADTDTPVAPVDTAPPPPAPTVQISGPALHDPCAGDLTLAATLSGAPAGTWSWSLEGNDLSPAFLAYAANRNAPTLVVPQVELTRSPFLRVHVEAHTLNGTAQADHQQPIDVQHLEIVRPTNRHLWGYLSDAHTLSIDEVEAPCGIVPDLTYEWSVLGGLSFAPTVITDRATLEIPGHTLPLDTQVVVGGYVRDTVHGFDAYDLWVIDVRRQPIVVALDPSGTATVDVADDIVVSAAGSYDPDYPAILPPQGALYEWHCWDGNGTTCGHVTSSDPTFSMPASSVGGGGATIFLTLWMPDGRNAIDYVWVSVEP